MGGGRRLRHPRRPARYEGLILDKASDLIPGTTHDQDYSKEANKQAADHPGCEGVSKHPTFR